MQFGEKLKYQTWENGKKPSFGPDFGPFGLYSDRQNFFSKIWLYQSLDNMVSYRHVQCLKKLMIQSWEISVTAGGRTGGRKDGQKDKSGFIGRWLTNVFDNSNKNRNRRLCGNSEDYWKWGK